MRLRALTVMLAAALSWHGAGAAAAAKKTARPPSACTNVASHSQHPLLHAGCVIQTGIASWYGEAHHGLPTASGEIFDMNTLTAAHPTLPMNALVRVTCPRTGRSVVVRINDRIPASGGRIIDLSAKAAALLGMKARGVAKVRLVLLEKGDV
ncbi:MAG: septal ring lytic transglycosylase RlpA family protein [Alphaproteobacteria bacterium]